MALSLTQKRSYSYPLALLLALLVTFALFLFMYQLIRSDANRTELLEAIEIVNITPPEPEDKLEPEESEAQPDQPPEEPLLAELNVSSPIKAPNIQVDIPPMAMQVGEFKIRSSSNWSPPAGLGQVATGDFGNGKGNNGFRVVEPRGSRQPNIPQIAWDNKIDGWVLLSFVINNDGRVGKVQVLDAHPRGIFEEDAIAAISSWLYDSFKGPPIQLTQKIELHWKDYPNNIRQLY